MNPRTILRPILIALVLPALFLSSELRAETFVSVEGAGLWQTRNDQRIPGVGGTLISLSDIDSGPFAVYRAYLSYQFGERHQIRALYAPLSATVTGQFGSTVTFMDGTFAANTTTEGLYRFNSYRLTYAYHFDSSGPWKFAFGFTGKIRDAEVRLTQGALTRSKTNVGFVPLLNFQARRDLGSSWAFTADLDGLAAPQGRAFDLALFLERDLGFAGLRAFGGYRMLEGGADNDEVYNFAWLHYASLGLKAAF
jgi:hypothetical protein